MNLRMGWGRGEKRLGILRERRRIAGKDERLMNALSN